MLKIIHNEETIIVSKFPFLVGRSEHNDLVLSDSSVSAQHLEVHLEHGRPIIKNLSKTNGIICEDEVFEKMTIEGKKKIKIGHTELIFENCIDITQTLQLDFHKLNNKRNYIILALKITLIFTFLMISHYYFPYKNEDSVKSIFGKNLTSIILFELFVGFLIIVGRLITKTFKVMKIHHLAYNFLGLFLISNLVEIVSSLLLGHFWLTRIFISKLYFFIIILYGVTYYIKILYPKKTTYIMKWLVSISFISLSTTFLLGHLLDESLKYRVNIRPFMKLYDYSDSPKSKIIFDKFDDIHRKLQNDRTDKNQ